MGWWVPVVQTAAIVYSIYNQDQANRQRQSQYNAQAAEYRRYAEAQYKITQKKMGLIRTQSLRKQDEIKAIGQIQANQIQMAGKSAVADISVQTAASGAVVGYGTPGQLEFQQMLLTNKASANVQNQANLTAHNLKVKTDRQIDIMQDSADLARSSMYAKASWAESAAAATEASRLIEGTGTLLTGMGTIAQTQYMMPNEQRLSYFQTSWHGSNSDNLNRSYVLLNRFMMFLHSRMFLHLRIRSVMCFSVKTLHGKNLVTRLWTLQQLQGKSLHQKVHV